MFKAPIVPLHSKQTKVEHKWWTCDGLFKKESHVCTCAQDFHINDT
jgi:hypothetical protein